METPMTHDQVNKAPSTAVCGHGSSGNVLPRVIRFAAVDKKRNTEPFNLIGHVILALEVYG
jgi:hypothetical protein